MAEDITQSPEKQRQEFNLYISQIPERLHEQETEIFISRGIAEKIVEEKKELGFELANELSSRNGIFIEIAGPTPEGFSLVDYEKLDRPVLTSNIKPGIPLWDDKTGELVTYWGKVDFQADSQKLPLRNESVGALFGSCLEQNTIPKTLKEAARILEPRGILVLQQVMESSLNQIEPMFEELGFKVQQSVKKQNEAGQKASNLILQRIT